MKKLCILFLALLLFACAKKSVGPQTETPELGQYWQKMLAAPAQTDPYRMQVSLRFGSEGDTRRVTGIIWGNNDENIRLDIMAGVGAVIAKIEESGDHFLLFEPSANRAFVHDGPNRPLLKIGVPLPFTLIQLADLLNGHYARVFGSEYTDCALQDGVPCYNLEGDAAGVLSLDANGLPQEWMQQGQGWRLAISYGDNNLPKAIRLENARGKKAILLVKVRETPDKPFDQEQMRLVPPEETPVLPLSEYKPA